MQLSALPFCENRAGETETGNMAIEAGESFKEMKKNASVSNGRLNFAKMVWNFK